jgi:hypothetical protein
LRPTSKAIEAAAHVLHEVGLRHQWWEPYRKTYDEIAATDGEDFDAIVEWMLLAAHAARDQAAGEAENWGRKGKFSSDQKKNILRTWNK